MSKTSTLLVVLSIGAAGSAALAQRLHSGRHRPHAGRAHRASAASGGLDKLVFHGTTTGFREKAKTTMLPGPAEEYGSIQDYLNGVVVPLDDEQVLAQFPQVKHTHADRVEPERHKALVHAKLYAIRLEEDNDFHCIIGDGETGPYINAEVSGLPKHGSQDSFIGVRKRLMELMGAAGVQKSRVKYFRPKPPIPVIVAGSLFYDAEHKKGTIGPDKSPTEGPARKAVTQWEIHPVHLIRREPEP